MHRQGRENKLRDDAIRLGARGVVQIHAPPTEFRSTVSVLEGRGGEGQRGIAMQRERGGGDGVAGDGRQ